MQYFVHKLINCLRKGWTFRFGPSWLSTTDPTLSSSVMPACSQLFFFCFVFFRKTTYLDPTSVHLPLTSHPFSLSVNLFLSFSLCKCAVDPGWHTMLYALHSPPGPMKPLTVRENQFTFNQHITPISVSPFAPLSLMSNEQRLIRN